MSESDDTQSDGDELSASPKPNLLLNDSHGSYHARLMDDEMIVNLRQALQRSEKELEQNGFMKEFASKPQKVERIELQVSTTTSDNQRSSVHIRRRDSFATAVVKHHCGIDPTIYEQPQLHPSPPNSRPVSAIQKPTAPKAPCKQRPATVFVGQQQQRRRFQSVFCEEKASFQALEAQYSTMKDTLLRHLDRLSLHGRADFDVSHTVYTKLKKFDEKLHIEHPEEEDRKPRRSIHATSQLPNVNKDRVVCRR